MSKLTFADISTTLEKTKSKNTARAYIGNLSRIINGVAKPKESISDTLSRVDDIVNFIDLKSGAGDDMKRQYLSSYLYALNEFEFPHKLIKEVKSLIGKSMVRSRIARDKLMNESDKTIDEAKDVFKQLKEVYDITVKNMPDIYIGNRQVAALLRFYLTFGVLRASEFASLMFYEVPPPAKLEEDRQIEEDARPANYIDRKTRELVITDHKNKSYGERRVTLDDDKFFEIISVAKHNSHFFPGERKPSVSGDSFNKRIKRIFKKIDRNNHDLRSMKVSLAANNDEKEIIGLQAIQGHNVDTMLKHYNKYHN